MSKSGPNKKGKYHTGYFSPRNISKYIGNIEKIIYRSGWEFKFMMFCDKNDSILKWSSEPLRIPYTCPVSKDKFGNPKKRVYLVDFWLEVLTVDGSIKKYLIEIKPLQQLIKPKPLIDKITEKKLQNYNTALATWLVNREKFSTATKYCDSMGWKFSVITQENHPWLNV